MKRYRKNKPLNMPQWLNSSSAENSDRFRYNKKLSLLGAMKQMQNSYQQNTKRQRSTAINNFSYQQKPLEKAINNYFRPPAATPQKQVRAFKQQNQDIYTTPFNMSAPYIRKMSKITIKSPSPLKSAAGISSREYYPVQGAQKKKNQLQKGALQRFRIAMQKRSSGNSLVVNETIQNALKARCQQRRQKAAKMPLPPLEDVINFDLLPNSTIKKESKSIKDVTEDLSKQLFPSAQTPVKKQHTFEQNKVQQQLKQNNIQQLKKQISKKQALQTISMSAKTQKVIQQDQKEQKSNKKKTTIHISEPKIAKPNKQQNILDKIPKAEPKPSQTKQTKKKTQTQAIKKQKQKQKQKIDQSQACLQIQEIVLQSKVFVKNQKKPQEKQKDQKKQNQKDRVIFHQSSSSLKLSQQKIDHFLSYFDLIDDIGQYRRQSKDFYKQKSPQIQKLFLKSSYYMAHQYLYLTTKTFNFFKKGIFAQGFYQFNEQDLKILVQNEDFKVLMEEMQQGFDQIKKLLKICYNNVKKDLPQDKQVLHIDGTRNFHKDCCSSLIKQLQHNYILWKNLPKNEEMQNRCAYLINIIFDLKLLNGEEIQKKHPECLQSNPAKFIDANKDQLMND